MTDKEEAAAKKPEEVTIPFATLPITEYLFGERAPVELGTGRPIRGINANKINADDYQELT